jgi:uncharacterized protein (DUF1501 family)
MRRSGMCALSMAALGRSMETFGAVSSLTPQSSGDYKALVIVFLLGGNDGINTVVPIHDDSSVSNYADYAAARATNGLALPRPPLLPISVPRLGGLEYGLHPDLGPISTGMNNGLHELYGKGKLAIVANVGSLVTPLTKAQFLDPLSKKPYQLYSHSDQTAQAQTAMSAAPGLTGWGGRIADRMSPTHNSGGLVPLITSIAGAQLITTGQSTLPLGIADSQTPLDRVLHVEGYEPLTGLAQARLTAFNALRSQDLGANFIAAASHVTDLAVQANTALQTTREVTVAFPDSGLGRQLKQVARLIKKRNDLNVRRQVFYAQVNGFDTHAGQLIPHRMLLGEFSQAVRAFYDEMEVQGVGNDVTAFTLSDFGRTLGPTGAGLTVGSDHAWGNHLFVLGGAVNGGDVYGSLRPDGTGSYFPTLRYGGPDDTETGSTARGRWIPTTSVDQYAVRLARWFGLSRADEAVVFPNFGAMASHDAQNGRLDFLS